MLSPPPQDSRSRHGGIAPTFPALHIGIHCRWERGQNLSARLSVRLSAVSLLGGLADWFDGYLPLGRDLSARLSAVLRVWRILRLGGCPRSLCRRNWGSPNPAAEQRCAHKGASVRACNDPTGLVPVVKEMEGWRPHLYSISFTHVPPPRRGRGGLPPDSGAGQALRRHAEYAIIRQT